MKEIIIDNKLLDNLDEVMNSYFRYLGFNDNEVNKAIIKTPFGLQFEYFFNDLPSMYLTVDVYNPE